MGAKVCPRLSQTKHHMKTRAAVIESSRLDASTPHLTFQNTGHASGQGQVNFKMYFQTYSLQNGSTGHKRSEHKQSAPTCTSNTCMTSKLSKLTAGFEYLQGLRIPGVCKVTWGRQRTPRRPSPPPKKKTRRWVHICIVGMHSRIADEAGYLLISYTSPPDHLPKN